MRQRWAFFISAAVHGLAFALLLVLAQPSTLPETANFDLVTLQPAGGKQVGVAASAPRVKPRPPEARPADPVTAAESAPALPTGTQTAEASNENVGESNLDAAMGRAPRNESERYLATVRDRIATQQVYPAASRAFREEGMVMLRLTLDRSGSLTKVEMLEASPFKRLNDAAMRAVLKAAPFGAFPNEVAFQTWKITLPVRFTLAGS